MNQIFDFFLEAYKATPAYQIILEAIAFVFGVSNRYNMYRNYGVFIVHKRLLWRYDDEFLLFCDECLWLVELVAKKRKCVCGSYLSNKC